MVETLAAQNFFSTSVASKPPGRLDNAEVGLPSARQILRTVEAVEQPSVDRLVGTNHACETLGYRSPEIRKLIEFGVLQPCNSDWVAATASGCLIFSDWSQTRRENHERGHHERRRRGREEPRCRRSTRPHQRRRKGAAGGRKCQTKPYEVVTHLRLGSRLMPPVDTDYGIREFAVVDKSGNLVRLG